MNTTTLTWTSYVFSAFLCCKCSLVTSRKHIHHIQKWRGQCRSSEKSDLVLAWQIWQWLLMSFKNEAALVLWQCESFGCSCGKLLRSTCVAKDPQFHGFIMRLTAWFMKHCLPGPIFDAGGSSPKMRQSLSAGFPFMVCSGCSILCTMTIGSLFQMPTLFITLQCPIWQIHDTCPQVCFFFCGATMLYTLTLCSSKEIVQQ